MSGLLMFYNISKYRSIYSLTKDFLENKGTILNQGPKTYHSFIIFFFIGYSVIFFALLNNIQIVDDLLTAIIFLFGSIFVLIDITLQIKLFSSIKKSIKVL